MRWHRVILIAGILIAVDALKHERRSHFTSVEDEEDKPEDKPHLFDVKQLVKGTIDAIGGQGTTAKPDSLYQLFQLPSEILTQIASDAGYIEETTTKKPKRKRSKKTKKYRKISEDGSYEGTYVRVADDDDEFEEEDDGYKPRKKNKRRHHKPIYTDPNYVPRPVVTAPAAQSDVPQPAPRQTSPLSSLFAPLPSFPIPQLPTVSLPTYAPLVITTTTPVPTTTAPVVAPLQQAVPSVNVEVADGPQYAYQPIVTPDGKRYYQRVLILPAAAAAAAPVHPAATVVHPSTTAAPTTVTTTTTQAPTTTTAGSFYTEAPQTVAPLQTAAPVETVTRRNRKIRRRLIKTSPIVVPEGGEAIQQQQPQSDVPVAPAAPSAAADESTTMRPVAITFSPSLELFKTTQPPLELIGLQEKKEIKIKPRTHGTRTHSVGKPIEAQEEPTMKYVKEEESTTTDSPMPTPPVPSFSPQLITAQLATVEEQMKNNEVFSTSFETKREAAAIGAPKITSLHEEAAPVEEKKKMKRRKSKKGGKKREERVKKVESDEVEDIKEAVEAVRREKKEKVLRRFHKSESLEEEKKEEEEEVTTTVKPKKRRVHKKKSRRVEEEQEKKEDREEPTEESPIEPASPSTASFRRSLAPALIDVRELNEDTPSKGNTPTIRHVHHAERLAVLRKSLEAKARGVKQVSTHEKPEEEESEKINDQVSKPLTDLSDIFPSSAAEVTPEPKKKRTRRVHKKRKTTTVAPTTTTTTTTTTTEAPTTTVEREEEEEESYELEDEEYEEGEEKKEDLSYEIDENGDKIVITPTPKTKATKKTVTTTTTTTEAPTTTETPKKLKVLRPHCLNIRSFARQFGMVDVFEFVEEHCSFIENYYPSLTCDRREEYLAYCAGVWDSTKI